MNWRRLKFRLSQIQVSAVERGLPAGYYAQMRPVYAKKGWDQDRRTYERLHDWPHLRDGNRVLQAHLLLDMVKTLPDGDYAELGTYRGNYARLIYGRMAPEAHLYCFDTFEGFEKGDVATERRVSGVATSAGQFGDTSVDLVVRNITNGAAAPRLVVRNGCFPATFADVAHLTWRFVLLDADLYAPIKAGLELFWPRLVPGGVLVVHDYLSPHFRGAYQAVHEFFDPLGIIPVPWPDRVGSAVVVKNRPPAE